MTRRLAVAILAAGSLLAVAAAPSVTAPPAAETSAGGAVRVAVVPSSRIAAVVAWSPDGGRTGPAPAHRALRAALRVALDAARPRVAAPADLLLDEGGTLAAGFEVEAGETNALLGALATLAQPGEPGDAAVERALASVRRADAEARPLDAARRDVLARLSGSSPPAGAAASGPDDVRRALDRLREWPVRIVALGPAGFAARAADRLAGRLASGSAPAADSLPPARRAVAFPGGSSSAVIVIGYRAPSGLAGELGAAVPLMAEVLTDGPGSLRQRLSVAIDAPHVVRVRLVPLAGGREGALLLEIGVPPDRAERAYDVVDGAISSLGALPPRESALVSARSRLDAAASAFRGQAGREVLERLLLPEAWHWPPPDRWTRPLDPHGFSAAARRLLVRERSAVAVAGRLPRSLAERPRDPSTGGAAAEVPSSEPDGLLARVARRLAPGRRPRPDEDFDSRYVVVESTPLGDVRASLEVGSRGGEVLVARAAPGSRRSAARAAAGAAAGRDRRLAFAMRQPAVMLAVAEAGRAVIDETSVPCGAGRCPALLAQLDDGTRLELVIDPATNDPIELRTRWCCSDEDEPHDDVVSYREWVENEGVRIASRMSAEDESGGKRDIELVEWTWITVHAADPR